jgi:hypothetical protein
MNIPPKEYVGHKNWINAIVSFNNKRGHLIVSASNDETIKI